jgi:hypothetical protein
MAIAFRPEEQARWTVAPAVVTGRPASSAPRAGHVARGGHAAGHHVLDLGRIDLGASHGMFDRMPEDRHVGRCC